MSINWILICPETLCWVHPVGYRFWWQGLLDYFVTYLIFLLTVKLPPIEKSKTRPNLPYPTLPCPPHQTLPALPLTLPIVAYSTTPPLPSYSTTTPTPLYQYLSFPYWDWTLHSDSTTLSTTPSPTPTPIFINTQHPPPLSLSYPTLIPTPYWNLAETTQGRNDQGPKRPTFLGLNDPPQKLAETTQAETTQGRNDPDSS